MRSAVAILLLLCSYQVLAGFTPKITKLSDNRVTSRKVASPKLDLCPTCVSFMDQALNQLLNILLNSGVIGSCAELCGLLPNELEATACDLLCDYVGIEVFIDAINAEDPDPIYICQLVDLCPVVTNGAATIVKTAVAPLKGPTGTTFTIGMIYNVTSAIGPGLLSIVIAPENGGFPVGDSEFNEGQAAGLYQVNWQVQTTPSESEDWSAGLYQVGLAICEGDCTNAHPWGGVYAQANTTFTITGSN